MSKTEIKSLAASLEADTYALCQPAGRMVGSAGHSVAERFVARRLEETGLLPYRGEDFALPYEWNGVHFKNFAGMVPGRDRSLPPMLVGAHYDSVIAAPCADDNGAAVAICLALGELAGKHGGFERDLIVAIFDAEEPPHFQEPSMGSNRFGEDQVDERGIHFAMIYDLVGDDIPMPTGALLGGKDVGLPFLRDLVFATGSESHPELPDLLGNIALPERLKLIATLNRYVGDMSDHGVFRRNDVPYVFFSCGRWEHYHRPTDTPDRLNYEKMARLTTLSFDILLRADEAELMPFVEPDDPVEFEAETFRRTAGMFLSLLCHMAGVRDLRDRDSIDRVVSLMLSTGL
jgi:hypothetical protein